ncbi:TniQ family protein [Rhizobium sp.]|jgi:hypothetical protein|uniref:TniQ family protein n=1 Tax=Rhizobium sp. TaxID=391 RepID=UPI000E8EA0C2|nr:hypothetical protein [Rhizobium sp.]
MHNTHYDKLPVSVKFHEDETTLSYVSRLANSNGFQSAAELFDFAGLNRVRLLHLGNSEAAALELLTGLPKSRFLAFSTSPNTLVQFGSAVIKSAYLQKTGTRYCSCCLASDLATGTGRISSRPYLRCAWMWKMISHCTIHNIPLRQRNEGPEILFSSADWVQEEAAKDVVYGGRVFASERYLASRITGEGSDFLGSLPAFVAGEVCAVLGRMAMSLEKCDLGGRWQNPFFEPEFREKGYEIASQGRDAIWSFLSSYVDTTINNVLQYSMAYAPAYSWLAKKVDDSNYRPIIELFQSHAEEHIPLIGDEIFLTPAKSPQVHTLATAAKEYGLPEQRVRKVLDEHIGSSFNKCRRTMVSKIFRRDEMHDALVREQSLMTTPEVAKRLGIRLAHLDALFAFGLLQFESEGSDGARVFRRVRTEDVESLKASLEAKVEACNHPLATAKLTDAVAKTHRTLVEIASLILNGELTRLAASDTDVNFSTVLVDLNEIPRKSETSGWMGIRRAAYYLRTSPGAVKYLLENRYLRFTTITDAKSGELSEKIDPNELDRFSSEYISLGNLANSLGLNMQKLRMKLEANKLKPLGTPSTRSTTFYRKEDVTAIGLQT